MKPLIIGIVPRYYDQVNDKLTINMNYLNYFNQHNIAIIVLPLENPQLETTLSLCDGLLISGGSDLDPKLYQQTNQGLSRNVNQQLDLIDQLVVNYALKHQIPLLGICRGIQSIAVFLGGSLYQDLDSEQINHPVNDHTHLVTKVATTKLSQLLPDTFEVNSFHHQAVNQVPPGFIATFVNDQTIEAIEHLSLPIIGFQWHPERLASPETKIIFDYFIELITSPQLPTNHQVFRNNIPEKIIDTKKVYQGPIFKLFQHQVLLPSQQESVRDVIIHDGGAAVVAIDDQNQILLVRQYRIAIDRYTLELPAGKIEPSELPIVTIDRELREETGYQAKSITNLGLIYPTTGYSSEKIYLFLATDLVYNPLDPDFDESIALVRVPLEQFEFYIKTQHINDAKTIIGYYRYLDTRVKD